MFVKKRWDDWDSGTGRPKWLVFNVYAVPTFVPGLSRAGQAKLSHIAVNPFVLKNLHGIWGCPAVTKIARFWHLGRSRSRGVAATWGSVTARLRSQFVKGSICDRTIGGVRVPDLVDARGHVDHT